MSEQSTKPKHEESQREREERRAALLAQYEVPKKITSRKLDSDILPPPPAPAKKDKPKHEPETRLQKKRRFRYYRDICAGVVVIAALVFMLMPKEWANRKDEVVLAPAEPAPPPAPPAPTYANAADWVAKVRIGGVLSTRILIDGKPCVRELPVGPFSVRWLRRDNNTLIFQGPDGTEYRRELPR